MTNTLSEKWGIDTNILVYTLDINSPFNTTAKDIFHQIYLENFLAVVAQQNIIETVNVLHRTNRQSVSLAYGSVLGLISDYGVTIASPTEKTYQRFQCLV